MSVVDPHTDGDSALDDIHVLHVDDEPDFADMAAAYLEGEADLSVTTETSARDGLARIEETAFDCIVSDYEMPNMDGLEFLEAVRDSFPDLPFILYTGKGSEDVAADAIEAGVTAYQQKETGTAQYTVLANRIRSHVDQFRTRAEANTLKEEYGLIAEMATDVFWVYDPATDSASLSDGVAQFGYDPDEIDEPFDWWRNRLHPDDYDRVQSLHDALLAREPAAFETLTAERGVASVEYRFRKADGDYAYCESSCIVLFEDGTPLKIAGALTDITEQREYERQLETTRERMELALETTGALIWEWYPESGKYSTYPSVETLFDTDIESFEEFLGLVHPEDRQAVEEALDTALEFPTPYSAEYRIVLDETVRWIQADGQVFRDGPDGATRMVGVAMDVTQRAGRQRRLEQERNHREALFESATDPVLEVRYESDVPIIEQINPAFEDAFGVEATNVVGRSVGEAVVPAAQREEHEDIAQRVRDGEPVTAEVRRETTDGTRDFLLQVVPVERHDGTRGAYAWYTDITEQRERERAVESERAFMDQALDLLDDVFYVIDTDGELSRWNDALTTVTGYTDAEVADMDAIDFFPDDEQQRVAEAIEETLTTGRASVEAEFLTADGDRIPYEFTGSSLLDAEGSVVGLVGIGRDISDYERHRTALSALHDTTEAFMDASSRLAVVNHAAETARTVLSMPFNTIWLYEEATATLQPTAWTDEAASIIDEMPVYSDGDSLSWQAFEDGETRLYADLQDEPGRYNPETPIRSEIVLPLGDHGVMNIASLEPDAFDDIDVSLAHILGDLIETALDRANREQELRTQRHELQRQNERLEEFASVISHDLRNPLSVAEGRLELAREECESEHLDDVDRAIDRTKALIEDLLTLARQGETVSALEPLDLADLAAASWSNVDTAAATLRNEADRTVRGDDGRLKQLLENLFRNAVEHGGPDVTVTVGTDDGCFYVEDDGPGIREDERGDVFEAGYSLTDGGTGLGLSIVKRIAEAHGWEVTVTESDAGGARFEFTGVETDA